MIIRIIKIILIVFSLQTLLIENVYSNTNILIKVTIGDEIITNIDIEKEGNYLKLLNTNLENLNESQIFLIAKNNLINEIIKKKEIEKFFDLKKENSLINKVFYSLSEKIGFQKEEEFENFLKKKKSYTPEEIKEKLKVEIYWNDLIFLKYKNQIIIDENELKNRIHKQKNNYITEYELSEIVFQKKNASSFEEQLKVIKDSIKTIGFNNTANIYSISNSSKLGGNVGWINEKSLSKTIIEKLKNLNVGDNTDLIQLGNNYLLIKIEDKRTTNIEIDKELELKKMIEFEKNEQLNRFSNIYFNKTKMNFSINEK